MLEDFSDTSALFQFHYPFKVAVHLEIDFGMGSSFVWHVMQH
jgi:hypothetical protein